MPEAVSTRKRTVADVMSSPAFTALPTETAAQAAGRMAEHKMGSVIVVEQNRPVGILTERDLIRLAAAGADPSATKVSEWMTENPDTVAPDLEVTEAWKSLAEHGYRHIPVVQDTELVGVLSMRDLMGIAQI